MPETNGSLTKAKKSFKEAGNEIEEYISGLDKHSFIEIVKEIGTIGGYILRKSQSL